MRATVIGMERVQLANLPTPLEPVERLTAAWGGPRVWVKRDDLTGFGLSGNKVRKLEYHLAAAKRAGADTLITTGAIQSNHCRATALVAARVGLHCHLLLRTPDGLPPAEVRGNHLLHRLSGATIHFVTPEQYTVRNQLMLELADGLSEESRAAWIVPEGASDYLGMLGFAAAGRELADQLGAVPTVPAVWHPSSSGGTTAGLAVAAAQSGGRFTVIGSSVGDTAGELAARLDVIFAESSTHMTLPSDLTDPVLTDEYVGGGYAVVSDEELSCQVEATRLTGLIFDPVYTGKSIYGLREAIRTGSLADYEDVIFWHTGGGFGVFAHDFSFLSAEQ